jgi:apolipoprotein N-acyltransferase
MDIGMNETSANVAILTRIGDFLRNLPPWRARLAAFVAGALSALGFAPFGIFPLLLLGFAALVLLLDGAVTWRRAAWIGWAFGFGQFLVGLHWVGYAFLVDSQDHAWQIPFVAILFPGGLALFFAAATALAHAFWREGAARIFVLTAAISLTEWLRGHILTGFPWNLAGYGWGASLGVMQSAALFGVYGLTLLTILFGASLSEMFAPRRAFGFPLAMTALFAVLFLGGEARLAEKQDKDVAGVQLRIVQPNVAQADKYKPDLIEPNWQRLLALSATPARIAPTHVIWPEAALVTRSPYARQQIAALTHGDRVLMTGATRARDVDGERRYYNSFYVFAKDGHPVTVYDKFHLVPFGEYLPLGDLLSQLGVTKLVGVAGEFSTGPGLRTIDVPGAPQASPLICYEILFPGEAVADERARWIVNITDDSWFGPWAGPRQHLLVAQTRAIEEGLPVIRAANTGISAVIDAFGRVRARLGLDSAGILDSGLPAAIEPTPFARAGELGFWLLVLSCIAGAVLAVQNAPRTDEGRN